MHPNLEEWDEAYLRQIADMPESVTLEKKASAKFDPRAHKAETRDELAKQSCAFANAQGGFLVYGIDTGGNFDGGVEENVDRQPAKAWVEQIAPKLLQPPLHSSEAKFIPIIGHHASGYGVLVVAIPLSENRPHYILGTNEAYIRAGEHSAPMALQTFLDISTRGATNRGQILGLGVKPGKQPELDQRLNAWRISLNPVVRVETGPLCHHWAITLRPNLGHFVLWDRVPDGTTIQAADGALTIFGTRPLFPKLDTHVCNLPFEIVASNVDIEACLCLEASEPIIRSFSWNNLFSGQGA